ncbi:MAG TPA: MarR family transcriptional regulator [Thermoleophilia bacterium]|nr:MarR family transcriptional regulator [Thermoleophilia bacterium]
MAENTNELIDEVGGELGELRRAADRLDEAVATQFGVNRTDLRCLGILYRRGRVTAGELAEASGLTPGAITTALDRMERGGFANRVPDPTDRRRVLVTSTAATRDLGARLYGEVELAGRAQLEQLTPDHVEVIRDYLRGIRHFYEGLVEGMQSPAREADAAQDSGVAGSDASAPLAGVSLGRLELIKGAAKVTIRGDATLHELYRGHFDTPPEIKVDGGTVTIGQKRRFLPFDWRGAKSEVRLNPAVPWEIVLKGGMWKLSADFRDMELRYLEVDSGASDVEVWLPAPAGAVSIRVSGGASKVRLHRPAGAALRAEVSGGASQLVLDGHAQHAASGRSRVETPGFASATDGYDVRFSGGASQLVVDVVSSSSSPLRPA